MTMETPAVAGPAMLAVTSAPPCCLFPRQLSNTFRRLEHPMSHNTRTLLTVAAELRAAGASWEAVAAKVRRKPRTCQAWTTRFRDDWLALLKKLLPAGTPQRRIPLNINDAALLGGLDLASTLSAGRPVAQVGVLAHADRGVVTLAMAERLTVSTAARLAAVLDTQEVTIARDGVALQLPARLGVVALDEGLDGDEAVPAALLDRLAFLLALRTLQAEDDFNDWTAEEIAQAREMLPRVTAADGVIHALCAAALALGVYSLRARPQPFFD